MRKDPIYDSDLTNKRYVDRKISESKYEYVNKNGETVITKSYVITNGINGYLQIPHNIIGTNKIRITKASISNNERSYVLPTYYISVDKTVSPISLYVDKKDIVLISQNQWDSNWIIEVDLEYIKK